MPNGMLSDSREDLVIVREIEQAHVRGVKLGSQISTR